MSDDIKRRLNGQFAKGQTGNPDGARLRQPLRLLTPEDCHRIILKVAGSLSRTRTSKGERVTVFETSVRALAAGRKEGRLSHKDFIEFAKGSAYTIERIEREAMERNKRSQGGY